MYIARFADSHRVLARRKTEAAALRVAALRGNGERLHKEVRPIAIEVLPETECLKETRP